MWKFLILCLILAFDHADAGFNFKQNACKDLKDAIQKNDVDMVSTILETKKISPTCDNNSPMLLALAIGNVDIAEILFKNGAFPHSRDDRFLKLALVRKRSDLATAIVLDPRINIYDPAEIIAMAIEYEHDQSCLMAIMRKYSPSYYQNLNILVPRIKHQLLGYAEFHRFENLIEYLVDNSIIPDDNHNAVNFIHLGYTMTFSRILNINPYIVTFETINLALQRGLIDLVVQMVKVADSFRYSVVMSAISTRNTVLFQSLMFNLPPMPIHWFIAYELTDEMLDSLLKNNGIHSENSIERQMFRMALLGDYTSLHAILQATDQKDLSMKFIDQMLQLIPNQWYHYPSYFYVRDMLLNLKQIKENEMKIINDAFDLLGLSPDADCEKIKNTYKKIALKTHPDKVAHDERDAANKRMKAINRARDILVKFKEC